MLAGQGYKYCIAAARCGLCRFEIDDGEAVVVGTHAGDVSEKLNLRKNTGLADSVEYDKTPVCMCCGLCGPDEDSLPGPTEVPCYHFECFRFGKSVLSPGHLSTTAYKFEPTPSEERRRENVLLHSAAGGLPRLFPTQHLPAELWLNISRFIVREWAIAAVPLAILGKRLLPADHIGCSVEVDLSRNIYASYVLFEGVRYVRELCNATKDEAATPGKYRILNAAKYPSIQDVYLAFDHLGIRQVLFVAPNRVLSGPDPVPGLWWRRLSRQEGISRIEVASDGVKLRSIFDVSSDMSPKPWPGTRLERDIAWPIRDPGSTQLLVDIDWSTPRGESISLRLVSAGLKTRVPRGLRMTRLECNFPAITGYSAASHQDRVFVIHAHREGEAGPKYDWPGKYTPCHWIYMPMNPREYVNRVWVSPRRFASHNKSRGLTFGTNRGRVTSFVHSRPTSVAIDANNYFSHAYDRVHKPAKKGTAIYFSAFDPAKPSAEDHAHFAFESPTPTQKTGRLPRRAWPLSAPMAVEDFRERHFSFCRLQNVAEVIPCRSPPGQKYAEGAVIGMLVRYANGDRACVGAFRFDWAAEPCETGRTRKLYLGCGWGRVMDVGNHLPAADGGLSWTEIPLEGKLEWWFTYDRAEVHHIEVERLNQST